MIILLAILIEIACAAGAAWVLQRSLDHWSKHRIAFLAALPIPLILWGFCAYVFATAAMASKAACGVDACGMAIAGAMMGALAGVILYFLGIASAAATIQLGRSRKPKDLTDVFS